MTGPDYSGNGDPCPSCRVTTARYRIPVRAWILRRNDGTFNNPNPIRTDEIEEIIRETNNLFLNTNAGIQFYLSCEITFINNTNYYEDIENSSESDNMFSSIGEAGYVNVMFIHDNHDNWSGKAKFPTTNVAARRFKSAVTTYNGTTKYTDAEIASTLAHELGHIFGLQHTHAPGRAWWQTQNADNGLCYQESVDRSRRQGEGGGFCALTWLTGNPYKCEVNGDQLCDTEADPNIFPHSGVPNVTQPPGCTYSYNGSLDKYIEDNWGDAWTPPTRNIMSYSRAACIIEFSRKQVASMNYYILQFFNANTFVYTDPEFDIFEPDNQPLSAQRIAINSDQLHTFHWQPDVNASGQAEACDEDWVIFTITTTNNYVIQTKAVAGEPTPDTQISLFQGVPGSLTLVETNNDVSPANKLSRMMRSLNPGTYYLQVTQSEAYPATGSRGHYYIQVSDDCYTFFNTAYSISGPDAICGTNATFSLNNVPTGATIAWDKSANITYVSGQGTPNYTVSKGSNGSGFITAVVNSANCGSAQVQKNVQVGPTTANFSITAYPDCASPGEQVNFEANVGLADYNWIVSGGTVVVDWGNSIWVRMDDPSMEVQCHVTGTSAANCYSPQGASVTYVEECWSFMSTSPNPASTSFEVQLPGQIEEAEPVEVELRDINGAIVKHHTKHGKKFSINVVNLPEGAYILRAKFRGKTLSHRVMIEK